ncbi:MAG: hypothetical protein IFJ97_06975 [Acidobacteria bacterium]|uniref:Lipopolysaccharide kinase (Kdo/WaaP) family protein n=1 Tax=Candidatus Sulfomarinibacter kjeldsenii TaxID=2885994 RepID=A0A8J6YCB4_9BACT|nr:hypothetical protein [Candidatus Sulfomarinibacter kjeldsenii]
MPSGKDPIPGLPTRAELDQASKEYLTRGAPFKADVTVIDVGKGPMVVKDFARRSWWRRLIGRLEVNRESRAYTYLGPMPWFPAYIGRIDDNALAVEKVDGITLRFAGDIDDKREDYLGQLRTAMERLTELGFLHLDARAYRNVLRRPDGRVVFIDLAGSFWIPPGRLGHRLLRRFIALYYEANIIKWETMLAPGGDPRKGQAKPPRYVHGLVDLWSAWKRLRVRPPTQ